MLPMGDRVKELKSSGLKLQFIRAQVDISQPELYLISTYKQEWEEIRDVFLIYSNKVAEFTIYWLVTWRTRTWSHAKIKPNSSKRAPKGSGGCWEWGVLLVKDPMVKKPFRKKLYKYKYTLQTITYLVQSAAHQPTITSNPSVIPWAPLVPQWHFWYS